MKDGNLNENKRIAIFVPIFIMTAIFMVWLFKNYISADNSTTEIPHDFDLIAHENIDVNDLFSYGIPVILNFGASWCAPCQIMKPVLEQLNEKLRGQAIIKYVDVDRLQEFTSNFPVKVVPTQFFYNADGSPLISNEELPMQFIMYQSEITGEHALTAHEGLLDEQSLLLILEEMGLSYD